MCEQCIKQIDAIEDKINEAWKEAQIKRELIDEEYNTLKDKLRADMKVIFDGCTNHNKESD